MRLIVLQPFLTCLLGGLGCHLQSILYPLLELLLEADLTLHVMLAAFFDVVVMWRVWRFLIIRYE
jgi:hypothetical protein